MSALYFYLFGRFNAYYGERVLVGLDVCKVQELLCYLLINRHRPHFRENLADLLWGDCSAARSKGYLRKTLWQLQTALDAQDQNLSDRVLLVEPGWVQLKPEVDLYLDVTAFEQAFVRVQGIRGRELDSERAAVLQAAIDLYRGDLLEGWYRDWCLYERERLRHLYLAMLDKLMGYCEASRNCEAGLIYGERSLRHDPARERTHRRLMRLHCLARDRTAALRQYERCVHALKEELGVEPSRRTVDLYRQIRADRLTDGAPEPVETQTVSEAAPSSLPEVLEHLKQLQRVLAEAQGQVQREIQTVERALKGQ